MPRENIKDNKLETPGGGNKHKPPFRLLTIFSSIFTEIVKHIVIREGTNNCSYCIKEWRINVVLSTTLANFAIGLFAIPCNAENCPENARISRAIVLQVKLV